MKKLSKIIVSALVAASVASLAAVSVSAADYGSVPSYPTPSTPSAPSTSEDTDNANSEKNPADVVTEDVVADAIENGGVVYVTEDATVSEAAIGAIAEADEPVTFVTDTCTITIDPATITEVGAIDLTMAIDVAGSADVNGVDVPKSAIVIAPAQKGEFGMTVVVTIPAATVSDLDTDNLYFYYISDDGEVTDLSEDITVNDDGSVSVSISHASEYVITDEEIEVASDDEAEDDTDDDVTVDDADDDDTDSVVDAGTADADDTNPGTGVALGTAALAAISAAAVAVTAKKRK